mgnify:CR=1 FL=1
MTLSAVRRLFAVALLSASTYVSVAQPDTDSTYKAPKPYKVMTSGKQITIKSTKNIKHVMVWTVNGNRVVEQREINNTYYTFSIPVNQKAFYLMIGFDGGKIYTEKLGVQ